MQEGIERKFKKRFLGIPQFVSDYSDFRDIPEGSLAMILVQGKNNDFFAYFEGSEIEEELPCQRVFLQYEKEAIVKEYFLPLRGKIQRKDFIINEHKTYLIE